MSFSGKGGFTTDWASTEVVLLAGSTICGWEFVGIVATGVSDTSVIRGGLGAGRFVPDLKRIFAMSRAYVGYCCVSVEYAGCYGFCLFGLGCGCAGN